MRAVASIAVAALLAVSQVLGAAAPAAAAGPTWSTVRLSDNRTDGLPCVAIDSLGITYVAFARAGHQPGVWVSTNRSGSWRTSRLTTGPTDSCGGMSVDPLRHLHILIRRSGQFLYTTNRSGAWRTRVVAEDVTSASLISDRNGRVAIAYYDSIGIAIASNRSGTWRTSRIGRGLIWSMSRLAADSAGHLWLAYATPAGGFVATNRTGSWRARLIDRLGRANVDLGLDAAGHVYVALDRWSGPISVLSDRSGAWRTIHVVRTSSIFESMSVTRSGRIHIVLDTEGTITDHTNRSGAWQTLTLARHADFGSALALDRLGRVTIAWALSGSMMVTSNRSGSFRTTRLTSTSRDRVVAMTADGAGHHYVVLARSGVGAGTMLATDRSGSWAIGLVSAADPSSAAVALDAAGHIQIAYVAISGTGYFVEADGSWLARSLPPLDRVLLLTPDDPSGIRVIGTRGGDVVALRDDSGRWVVDTVAPAVGLCQDAVVDATGVVQVVCVGAAGLVRVRSAPGSWTTDLAAPRTNPYAAMTAERISVDGAGIVSVAFAEFLDDTGHDPGEQKIATYAGASWTTVSTGVVSFAGPAFVDLATDATGHRHLLTSGSGLVETEESTASWVSSPLPVGASPTIGRLTIDSAGVETVAAEIGAYRLEEDVDHAVEDAGIVILTR